MSLPCVIWLPQLFACPLSPASLLEGSMVRACRVDGQRDAWHDSASNAEAEARPASLTQPRLSSTPERALALLCRLLADLAQKQGSSSTTPKVLCTSPFGSRHLVGSPQSPSEALRPLASPGLGLANMDLVQELAH